MDLDLEFLARAHAFWHGNLDQVGNGGLYLKQRAGYIGTSLAMHRHARRELLITPLEVLVRCGAWLRGMVDAGPRGCWR